MTRHCWCDDFLGLYCANTNCCLRYLNIWSAYSGIFPTLCRLISPVEIPIQLTATHTNLTQALCNEMRYTRYIACLFSVIRNGFQNSRLFIFNFYNIIGFEGVYFTSIEPQARTRGHIQKKGQAKVHILIVNTNMITPIFEIRTLHDTISIMRIVNDMIYHSVACGATTKATKWSHTTNIPENYAALGDSCLEALIMLRCHCAAFVFVYFSALVFVLKYLLSGDPLKHRKAPAPQWLTRRVE